jgi:hypothetical protein
LNRFIKKPPECKAVVNPILGGEVPSVAAVSDTAGTLTR